MTDNDPLVSYVIVREDLNMSVGKSCAQVGHGVQNLILKYFTIQVLCRKCSDKLPEDLMVKVKTTTDWLDHGSRKVVLKADAKEFLKIKAEYPDSIVIKDAGLTEVESGTETCLTLWPRHKSEFSKSIKNLSALK